MHCPNVGPAVLRLPPFERGEAQGRGPALLSDANGILHVDRFSTLVTHAKVRQTFRRPFYSFSVILPAKFGIHQSVFQGSLCSGLSRLRLYCTC